jgi:uncharacterized protein GlcG (DUF336 family)
LEDELVGAIGASGGTGSQDEVCAKGGRRADQIGMPMRL